MSKLIRVDEDTHKDLQRLTDLLGLEKTDELIKKMLRLFKENIKTIGNNLKKK